MLKRILITIAIGLPSLLLVLLFFPQVLNLFGYYATTDEDGLAEYLLAHHLPVSDCRKLIHFEPLSPPPWSKQLDCMITYAKLSQDPAVCEELMPSEFGLSCMNDVMSQVFIGNAEAEHVTPEECININEPSLRHDNCLLINAHRTHDPNDCAEILNDPLRVGCQLKMGAWVQYPQLRSSFYFGNNRESL